VLLPNAPPGGGFAGQAGGGPAAGLFGGGGTSGGVQRRLFGGGLGGASPFAGSGGFGGGGLPAGAESYVSAHGGGTIAEANQSAAATAILASNAKVAGIGGFSGQESDPSIAWFADEVASGRIRWVLDSDIATTGVGRRPGATAVLDAVARACRSVPAVSASFYDCAGRASQLRALG
jgi:hypothetical protein